MNNFMNPQHDNLAQIRVIGVGGGGCNAVDRMLTGIDGVEFITVNTDLQALRDSKADVRVHLGSQLTRGLGSGGDPRIGQQSAEESQEELIEVLRGADMVFVAAGMGGGTGTGAAPVVAQVARDLGALTIGVVTRPFTFEGRYRQKIAEYGINQFRAAVDTLIIISNDRLIEAVSRETTMRDAFGMADNILHQGIQGIADIITKRGMINVDFNDVRTVMANAGAALMALGHGNGSGRVVEAVNKALNSPLLESGIDGARAILFNVTGGDDLGLLEVNEAAELISKAADPEANIIFGAVIDPEFPAGQVKITLVATGFDPEQNSGKNKRLATAQQPSSPAAPIRSKTPSAPAISTPVHRPTIPSSAEVISQVRPSNLTDDLDIPPFLRARRK